MPAKQNKKKPPAQPKARSVRPLAGRGAFVIPQWALPALLVFTALLYSKALFCGLTGLDDDFYITNNPDIRDFSLHGIRTIFTSYYTGNYQPLAMLIYLFEYKLFALNPLPYHLLDVLIHLVNVAVVFTLTERLSGQRVTALVVAVLFAVHPMHVESVAWVSELKDVTYALLYLLSVLVYLRYLSSGYRPVYYIGVLLLFLASLLCKSAAVTLPVLLVVIDIYRGRKINARSIVEKIPFLALSLGFGILAIISQRGAGAYNGFMISYGIINGFFLLTSGLAFYLIWLLAPVRLSVFHYFPTLHDGFLPWIYYASLPVVLIAAWLVLRRSKYRKEVWFGMAFFLVTISVMLQIISVGSALTSERYTYVSYIGLFYIIGMLVARYTADSRFRSLTIGLFAMFVVLFSAEAWQRIDIWKDDHTLFDDLIDKNPGFYYGYWLRGNTEKKEGNLKGALGDYSNALRLNPRFEDGYYNRGIVNDGLGDLKSAIADYTASIALKQNQADSYNNRGWAYYQTGDREAAMQDYRKAIKLKPNYAEAYNNLGWAYTQSGDMGSGMENFTKAVAIDPGFQKAVYNIAAVKTQAGDFNGALEQYNSLIKLYPDDSKAWLFRGKAHMELHDMASACADWQKAMALGNQYADDIIKKYCK